MKIGKLTALQNIIYVNSFETDLKCLNGNVRDMELPRYAS